MATRPATRSRPGVATSSALSDRRGRRECRVMASPMARLQQKKQAAVTTGSARSTGIPCAMVLRLIRDLPGDRALLPPSLHDHSRATWPQRREARTTRLRRPHWLARLFEPSASTASRTHVRDDRDTPLLVEAGRGDGNMDFGKTEVKYFWLWGLDG